MMEARQFSEVIAALYDCTLQPDGWRHVPDKIAALFRSERCFLHTRDNATGACGILGMTANLSTAGAAKYADHYFKQDVFAPGAARHGIGIACISQDILSDEEMLGSEFYQDFCRHLGIFHGAAAFIPVEQKFLGAIGIGRPHSDPAFETEDRATLQLLIPHLSRAMQLDRRLRECHDGRRIALGALEAMGCGVLIVDVASRLIFANGIAENLIRKTEGFAARNGRLHATETREQTHLQRAISAAAGATAGNPFTSGGLISLSRANGRPLSLLVCPVPTDAVPDMRARRPVIIFVDNPDDAVLPPAALLQKIYDLSPPEARLAAALIEGKRLQEYAEEAGVSLNTAKTHLKRVFAKTGSDRQSDLVRDALSSVILRMQTPPRTRG